jgi:CSLREA domain-containing protein
MTRAIRPIPWAAVAVVIALLALLALLHRGGPAYGALDVNRTDDPAPNGCTPEPGGCSLREAIIAANAVPSSPDTINIPGGFYTLTRGGLNENAASTGDLDILNNLTYINGAGSGFTIIDGGNLDRVFQVFLGKTVQITGLAIQNGYVNPGQGGALTIPTSATVTLDSVVIVTNEANDGGGIWNAGSLTITNTTIVDNIAYGTGGGILNGDSTANLNMAGATIRGNIAGGVGGGGLANAHNANLTNVTISDNYATDGGGGGGGGIYNYTTTTLNLNNVTVSHNTSSSATRGGGIRNASSATANLKNTIVANNVGGGGNCSTGVGHTAAVSYGHNLDSGTACAFGGAGDINNGNPNLGPLANNGGASFTRALLPGSQAIDSGDNNGCPAVDQRAVPRPQGAACDIGAYEVGSAPTPTPTPAPTPSPTPTPTPLPNSDNDGDGWTYASENLIGTDPADACGQLAWPADLVSQGTSTNKLDISDLAGFIAPLRRLGTSPGHPNYDRRWDIVPGAAMGAHINLTDVAALLSGPTAYPPMFSGARAYGQTCTP